MEESLAEGSAQRFRRKFKPVQMQVSYVRHQRLEHVGQRGDHMRRNDEPGGPQEGHGVRGEDEDVAEGEHGRGGGNGHDGQKTSRKSGNLPHAAGEGIGQRHGQGRDDDAGGYGHFQADDEGPPEARVVPYIQIPAQGETGGQKRVRPGFTERAYQQQGDRQKNVHKISDDEHGSSLSESFLPAVCTPTGYEAINLTCLYDG